MGDMNALDLLKEEMEQDELYIRINTVHRIRIVAQMLTSDQVKTKLFPYIEQLIKKEEDEVLFALASELGHISQVISNSLLPALIQLLECLVQLEETMVRNESICSLLTVCQHLSEVEIQTLVIPMVMRLANSESFLSRVSAVKLIVQLYGKAPSAREGLRIKFNELVHEETSMVKRAAALSIGDLAQVIEKNHLLNDLLQQFKELASDDLDSVRVASIQSLVPVVKVLSKELNKTTMLSILIQSTEDKSWKIRHALAQIFPQLIRVLNKDIQEMNLIGIFLNLLRDGENEVKMEALKGLQDFLEELSPEKLLRLVPHLRMLMEDNLKEARQLSLNIVGRLCVKVGKDNQLYKFQEQILKGLSDDDQQVKIGALECCEQYVQVLGGDHLGALMSNIKQGVDDVKWRVRLRAIQTVYGVAAAIHNTTVLLDVLQPLIFQGFKDKVFQIRRYCGQALPNIIHVYKVEWLDQGMFNKLVELYNSKNNNHRITSIQAIESIIGNVPLDYIHSKVIPLLQKMQSDPLVNFQIAFCKACQKLLMNIPNNQSQAIRALLQDHQASNDKDVMFFANQALGAKL